MVPEIKRRIAAIQCGGALKVTRNIKSDFPVAINGHVAVFSTQCFIDQIRFSGFTKLCSSVRERAANVNLTAFCVCIFLRRTPGTRSAPVRRFLGVSIERVQSSVGRAAGWLPPGIYQSQLGARPNVPGNICFDHVG